MNRWGPAKTRQGTRVQGAVPTSPTQVLRAGGLTLRGVVIAVYVYDSQPFLNQDGLQPNGIYVDVLLYGRHASVLPRVLWTLNRSGLHEGDVSLPRPATRAVPNLDFDVTKTAPQTMDGDHVVVGFLEDDLAQPYVVGCIPHPSSDIGNAAKPVGQRMRLEEADGHPRFWKQNGTAFGIDADGNFVLDTRGAHPGQVAYNADGTEPAPTNDGSNGNQVIDIQEGATVTLRIGNGANLLLTNADGSATLTLGDGAVSVAVADHLQTLWQQFKALFDAHTHIYAFGPTLPPPAPAPAWDPNINSNKVTIPDT